MSDSNTKANAPQGLTESACQSYQNRDRVIPRDLAGCLYGAGCGFDGAGILAAKPNRSSCGEGH